MAWRFKDRLDQRGENVIRAWLDGLPLKAMAKIDGRIRHLAVCGEFPSPYVEKIKGHDGVFELRVVSFDVQYRPLGGFGPGAGEFTLVMGAREIGDRIEPVNAFKTAEDWIRRLQTLRVCDHVYDIKTD